MKRPAFQFYPADWRNNAKLRRCSHAERGIWLEVMCLMHDSDEYGVLRWPLVEIAQVIGCTARELAPLVKREVLKGADEGQDFARFTYTPMHAGKAGDTVTLIEAQRGPIWFSSRMVVDEYLRSKRGATTRFTAEKNPSRSPNRREGSTADGNGSRAPTHGPGDGATASSSSSPKSGLSTSPTRSGEGQGHLKKFSDSTTSGRTPEESRELARRMAAGEDVLSAKRGA